VYYLAYGSNLHPLRIGARLGDIECLGAVTLPGWRLTMHKRGEDGSGKGNLVEDPDGTAFGVVYRLDAALKTRLDVFEGDGYDCTPMPVQLAGRHVSTFAYIAQPAWVDDALLPHDWYAELIEHGARHAGFPAAYLDWIAAHPRRPDAHGHRRHHALLQRLRAERDQSVHARHLDAGRSARED
jgi:hypothetical protein